MAAPKLPRFRNALLAGLPLDEQDALSRHLRHVELPRRKQIELPNRAIEHVYFPESGITSIVAEGGRKATGVEVGIIGREGMTGLAVIHGNDRFPYSSYMQVEGSAFRLEAEALRDAMALSPDCRRIFLAFAQTFMLQVSETAVANARASIEQRLARWLLMAQDRMEGAEVPLTHEFLSMMMGARRPGVTEAMHALAQSGIVGARRGVITIIDRPALIKHAGRHYGIPEREYERMLGIKPGNNLA